MINATLGADPEAFIARVSDGRLMNAIPIVGRNKSDPVMLEGDAKFYYDNVCGEMAFPPSNSVSEFIERMRDTFKSVKSFLGKDYTLRHQSSHVFTEEEIGPRPKIMMGQLPVAWEVGCNPSFCAYTKRPEIPVPFLDGLRTGSFHLHIGHELLEPDDMDIKGLAVRLMDIFVGCSSVVFDNDPTSKARRRLYGRCGSFRPTSYGIEARCLGNYALNSPRLVELVWDLCLHGLSHLENGTADAVIQSVSSLKVQQAVNECDVRLSKSILEIVGLPWKLQQRVHEASTLKLKPWEEAWGI